MSHHRIARARAWLSLRDRADELLIIGASLDAANELARSVVQTGRSVFGWHRFSLSQLTAALAAPTMAERGIVPVTRASPTISWPAMLSARAWVCAGSPLGGSGIIFYDRQV
jgi:hypothetical protein